MSFQMRSAPLLRMPGLFVTRRRGNWRLLGSRQHKQPSRKCKSLKRSLLQIQRRSGTFRSCLRPSLLFVPSWIFFMAAQSGPLFWPGTGASLLNSQPSSKDTFLQLSTSFMDSSTGRVAIHSWSESCPQRIECPESSGLTISIRETQSHITSLQ